MGESHIYEAIADHPEEIGFAGAVPIRQVSLGRGSGYVDLVLLPPVENCKRLVIIEAKRASNRGSLYEVIGQLLKYYDSALRMGASGLERLREFANTVRERSPNERVSYLKYCGGANQKVVAERVRAGTTLKPDQIQLFVALDEYTPLHSRRLGQIAESLRFHHSLELSLILVSDGMPVRPSW